MCFCNIAGACFLKVSCYGGLYICDARCSVNGSVSSPRIRAIRSLSCGIRDLMSFHGLCLNDMKGVSLTVYMDVSLSVSVLWRKET
jgi:hypothetical protein